MTDTPESVATSLAAPKRGSWGRKSCPRWSLRSLPAAQLSSEISPCWAERGLGLRPSPEIMFELPMWRKGPDGHDNPSIFKRSGRKFQVTLGRNSSGLQPGVCSSSCQQGQPKSAAGFSSSQKALGWGCACSPPTTQPQAGRTWGPAGSAQNLGCKVRAFGNDNNNYIYGVPTPHTEPFTAFTGKCCGGTTHVSEGSELPGKASGGGEARAGPRTVRRELSKAVGGKEPLG